MCSSPALGGGELGPLGIHHRGAFYRTFGLNVRGTLFTVQKALPLFSDGGFYHPERVHCGCEGFWARGSTLCEQSGSVFVCVDVDGG